MEGEKDATSDLGEGEDIPSDFFDDFTKDEFMDGLSVIDECWEEPGGSSTQKRSSRSRINAEALDSVKDLRELIGEGEDYKPKPKPYKGTYTPFNNKYRWRKPESPQPSDFDEFTKPGSRRDPNKTNEAIKKDKEVKVQQFLAKSLESTDDLRPPGTELDDYYEDEKLAKKHQLKDAEEQEPPYEEEHAKPHHSISPHRVRRSPRERYSPRFRRSPRQRHSPRPRYSPRGSPRRIPRNLSPFQQRHRYPNRKFSPFRNVRRKFSPPRRSPRRYSPPHHSPRRHHRSRSPRRRPVLRRSRSYSRSRSPRRDDSFLYPNKSDIPSGYPVGNPPLYQPEQGQQYAPPVHTDYPGNVPGYSYPQVPAYSGGFPDPYSYGAPQAPQACMPETLMPAVNPVPVPTLLDPSLAAPPMVPAPVTSIVDKATPYDALAQLVAEGKISKEDYLKLTPNKGATTSMDTKTRVMVLSRCNQAIGKLDKLLLPNRLMINNQAVGADVKYLAPKYCSPLKRQAVTEFNFTKGSISPSQQTKHLVESIITTLGLEKVVSKYKKKLPKDMKDAVIQTTKPACDVCVIRETTKYVDVGTSTEPEYFSSTVHTQVVEEDLVSSKSIFNPSGSMGEGAAMSIAHLTPAQLVSQLAARAKTLKQPQEPPPPNHFTRRPNYDYDGRGGQQYHHSYNNYRY